jgi:hypothetical protein
MKSNGITEIPNLKISQFTKDEYHAIRALKSITEGDLDSLLYCIMKDLGLKKHNFEFNGKRPCTRKGKRIASETHGTYNTGTHKIRVYKLTAAKQNLISAKSAISTLLHEIIHYVDTVILQLNSIHCKGFYARLQHLTKAMG